MYKILISFFLLFSFYEASARELSSYDLKINIPETAVSDSILLLDVSLTNNSDSDIVIFNPETYKVSDQFFFVPSTWNILIKHEGEECFTESLGTRISLNSSDLSKTIKSHHSYSFVVPININNLLCMNDPEIAYHLSRQGNFCIQLKIALNEPSELTLESNTLFFQVK
ncbi:MAG: hypothetical protein QM660_11445 [Dysgonomonas sp.]